MTTVVGAAVLRQQAFLHAALEGGAGVLQAERHGDVAVRPKGHDEGRLQGIGRVQLDLVVVGVGIKEGQQLTSGCGVEYLVYSRQSEWIFGAGFAKTGVINAHAPFVVLL